MINLLIPFFGSFLFVVVYLMNCQRQLLMGFESGLVVLWDLRTKVADSRFIASEPLRSVSWLSDGKQLISAHTDGSLYTWNSRAGPRPAPVSVTYPHGRFLPKLGRSHSFFGI
jgi:syntaxin-binding protein 5